MDINEMVTVPMFVEVGKELYGSASFTWSLQTILEGSISAIEHQKRHDCDCEGHEGRFYTLLALKEYYKQYIEHLDLLFMMIPRSWIDTLM